MYYVLGFELSGAGEYVFCMYWLVLVLGGTWGLVRVAIVVSLVL